ncbi:MAG: VPEID-CTERM sorting domain-containing protein [Alphaproteobacteria bacterium]|nr:VPEID-CTERM sorting domain-containing protein [Alphaproteobacteria bacterium]
MRPISKLILVASMVLWSVPSALALKWVCVPEIDASAGLSVIAILVSASVLAYERYKA